MPTCCGSQWEPVVPGEAAVRLTGGRTGVLLKWGKGCRTR